MLSIAALCFACLAAAQHSKPQAPVAAPVDGRATLAPGELPSEASAEARAAWLALAKATSGETAQAKVTGFDLRFDGRVRPVGRESHDFDDARYRYLEPGWIWTTFKDGTERLRGPRGDWFIKQGTATRLQGADFANDQRELDEQTRVAHSFVGLIDPRALRLQSLALVAAPPPVLPQSLVERARQLRWLEIASPDFLSDARKPTAVLARAWIGLDAATSLPELALVARDDGATIVHETALLVRMHKWTPLEGFRVPSELYSFQPDLARSPWAFSENPSLSLWLKGGTLRPKLAEGEFAPPEKR